jgi:hemerythrin-like domain-containing protein
MFKSRIPVLSVRLSISSRRNFLRASAATAGGLILSSCQSPTAPKGSAQSSKEAAAGSEDSKGDEVTATEDLMREHGVLRRALIVYSEAAAMLRKDSSAVSPNALQKTALLFRAFGEEYHERKLEEAYIFPAVKKAGGAASGYADILIAQHARGREITDYILAVTKASKVGTAGSTQLASAMESLVRMYRAHASREDTVVFPAWKQTLTAGELDEMNDKFEDIEHEQFGEDGFEDAVKQIGDIEGELGLADLSGFTAPTPPTAQ